MLKITSSYHSTITITTGSWVAIEYLRQLCNRDFGCIKHMNYEYQVI